MTQTAGATAEERPTRYREIEVRGKPFEMGRQIGETAREEILGFVAVGLERVNRTIPVSREKAYQLAASCIPYVEEYSPDLLDELRGMSEGAGVTLEDLMLLQVRNQLKPEHDAGCTSFSIGAPASASGRSMIGQNWDNDPALDPFTVVLTRRPEGKPALMNITQAGLIAYMGLSSAGMAVCLNTLPAHSREVGVPHYFTVRGICEATSLDGAVEAVRRAHRAIPANVMLASPEGPADLEVTVDEVRVLRDDGNSIVTHTNHCLHPELLAINQEFPELIQSYARKSRIDLLLNAAPGSLTLEHLKAALADHEGHPCSICRHPNDDPVLGFWRSVFSVIMEPEAGLMHVSRGNPCSAPYETYRLS